MNNIKHLLNVVDKQRDHIALGLMSDPGLSKTSQCKQWCEENNRQYYEFITSQRMPSEISGMAMPNHETERMTIYDFDYLLDMKDGDMLAFDEFTNGNIMTLNACLTLIQERHMLSGKDLPSIIVVAMGNPQGRCDMLPQTKQRFWWVNVKFNQDTWINYIKDTWGWTVPKSLANTIANQYKDGFKSDQWNYYTPRTIENLLRIAQDIEASDIFWSVSDIPSGLVNNLYKTTYSSGHEAQQIVECCLKWVEMQRNVMHHPLYLARLNDLEERLNKVETMKDLQELVRDFSAIPDSPAINNFIDWLKKTDEDKVTKP